MGFVWLCAVAAFTAGFFVWGSREPRLDRVWKILHGLKIGRIQSLDPADLGLLRDELSRFPDLGPALLEGRDLMLLSANREGWVETEKAYLLVVLDQGPAPRVKLRWRPQAGGRAARIVMAGEKDSIEVDLGIRGDASLAIPDGVRAGGVVEIRLSNAEDSGCRLSEGLQVSGD